jgi:Rho-binding antiterminator
MYTPISCEFFDQLNVAMKRKIPSTVVFMENKEKKTSKGLVETMSVIDGIEYLILNTNEQIRLDTVLTFNGRRHKEEDEV